MIQELFMIILGSVVEYYNILDDVAKIYPQLTDFEPNHSGYVSLL